MGPIHSLYVDFRRVHCSSSLASGFPKTRFYYEKANSSAQSSTLHTLETRTINARMPVCVVRISTVMSTLYLHRLLFMHSTLHCQFVSNNALVMMPQIAVGWYSQGYSRVYLPQCSTTSQIPLQGRLWWLSCTTFMARPTTQTFFSECRVQLEY